MCFTVACIGCYMLVFVFLPGYFFCISDVQHVWNALFYNGFLKKSVNFQLHCVNSQLQSAAQLLSLALLSF